MLFLFLIHMATVLIKMDMSVATINVLSDTPRLRGRHSVYGYACF